jgi:hypothetical protein
MLTPDLTAWIDHARSQGATYDHVVSLLHEAGHTNAKQIADQYTQVTDHTGRKRGQTNPGDPADPTYPQDRA